MFGFFRTSVHLGARLSRENPQAPWHPNTTSLMQIADRLPVCRTIQYHLTTQEKLRTLNLVPFEHTS
jgi:hypothetical protein